MPTKPHDSVVTPLHPHPSTSLPPSSSPPLHWTYSTLLLHGPKHPPLPPLLPGPVQVSEEEEDCSVFTVFVC